MSRSTFLGGGEVVTGQGIISRQKKMSSHIEYHVMFLACGGCSMYLHSYLRLFVEFIRTIPIHYSCLTMRIQRGEAPIGLYLEKN